MRVVLNILIVLMELALLFVILAASADPDFSSMARQLLARGVASTSGHREAATVVAAGGIPGAVGRPVR